VGDAHLGLVQRDDSVTQIHEGKTIEQLLELVDRVVCESCYGTKEITVRGYESDHTEQVECPDCKDRK